MNLLIFAVMLGILIFVHELGHFAVAKRLKVPVLEFGFGFPPRLWRFWKDHGWLEIQGRRIHVPREFSLPDNIVVGSRVTYRTETREGRETLTALALVDDENQGLVMVSQVQNLDRGTEYTLNWIPLGGFVRLLGEEDPNVPGGFGSAKMRVRVAVLFAGVTMNFILAYVLMMLVAALLPPSVPLDTTTLAGIAKNSPAAQAGLRAGDIIVKLNDREIKDDPDLLIQLTRQHAGQPIMLTTLRGKQLLDPVQVTPRAEPPQGEGPLGIALARGGLRVTNVEAGSVMERAGVRAGDVVILMGDPTEGLLYDQNMLAQFTQAHAGASLEFRLARGEQLSDPIIVTIPAQMSASNATLGLDLRTPIWDTPRVATMQMAQIAIAIPTLFGQMLRGSVPANSFVGVIGIYQATSEVARLAGAIGLLNWLALLSLNLAIVNLFPFPPLDGGQLVFILIEWLRGGKRVDPKKQGMVHLIGAAVLIGLMIIISYFDILRLISGQPILPVR
ncbi:MAG: RIP metalloprotease RseP [Chloroflexi bacterium]|nr:RIP metalloprotease RseP [Chloroflexota bacterium]